MQPLDVGVLFAYLAGVVAVGACFSRRPWTVHDYFLTGKQVPWWALLGAIVATETSTVTLISVPGYAFGGDLTFLQLALGYVIGRFAVASVLIPRLFQGDLMTAYQLLSARFGVEAGRLTASIFLVTRSLSDGFRLFATGVGVIGRAGHAPLERRGLASPASWSRRVNGLAGPFGRSHQRGDTRLYVARRHDGGDLVRRHLARCLHGRRCDRRPCAADRDPGRVE